MRVALIQCPVWGTREPPLSIVQLSACLKSRGFDVKSFDFNIFLYRNKSENFKTLWAWEQCMFWYSKDGVDKFYRDFCEIIDGYIENILNYDPQLMGLSISASTYHASCRFADILRGKEKNIKIVFGGPVFVDKSYMFSAFMDSPVDYIIPGDGDEVFSDLISIVEGNKDVGGCRGVYFKSGNDIKFTGDYPVAKNLDKLPYMDFTDLKIEYYDDKVHIAIMSSKGCIWQCAFCSSCAFDKGYRVMSAERIHQEITFHRTCNYDRTRKDNIGHIDFQDLTFNGDIKRVREFCDLMIKYPPCQMLPKLKWVANAVIRPELTPELIGRMAEAGCKKLIFGLESGSQKVLNLMKKNYKISDAKRIIKVAYEAGIEVTANFMFGFPGETEEDFQQTLDFINEIGPYLERVYPSRTYCAVEQYSYFHEHLDEFGVKMPVGHHLYWETLDGENTYPVRLRRCAKFEKLCNELGFLVDCGVKTSVDMDNWYNLAHYYEYKKDFVKASEYFLKYLNEDSQNETVLKKIETIYQQGNAKLPANIKKELKEVMEKNEGYEKL